MQRVARGIISVGGGKGGVGKSVVAANMAVAMAEEGHDVVVVDADLGGANQHTLFGVTKPGPTLQTFLEHGVESLEDARVPTSVRGVSLIRGATAVYGAANPGHASKQRLLRHVEALRADFIVIDVGAGAAFNQLDVFDAAEHKLVVLTPQLTSVENGYGFVKAAVFRALTPLLKAHGFETLLDGAGAETKKLSTGLREACTCSPKFAAEVSHTLAQFGLHLFGNQVGEAREEAVFTAVSRMIRDFLSVDAPVVATAKASRAMHESVNARTPLLSAHRHDDVSLALRRTAQVLLHRARSTHPAHVH